MAVTLKKYINGAFDSDEPFNTLKQAKDEIKAQKDAFTKEEKLSTKYRIV